MAKVRLHIEVSQELADILDSIAESEHATRSGNSARWEDPISAS
jgi:hypothetical protein